MQQKAKKVKVELTLTQFISDSGEVIEIQEKELSELLRNAIGKKEYQLDIECQKRDKVYHFNKLDGKTAKDRASTIFYGKFYIHYQGNPSMNGGNFYYEPYDVENGDEHLYYDNPPLSGKGYQYRILSGMACSNYYRWFGYGVNQAGFKFVRENPETAKEFIEYIKNDSLIPLDAKTVGHSSGFSRENEEFDQTLAQGLFWYCLRSSYFEGAKEFKSYMNDKKLLEDRAYEALKDIHDNCSEGYEEDYDDGWKVYYEKRINVIKALVGDTFPYKKNDYTHEMLKEISNSWINKKLNFIDKKTLKLN